MKTNTEDFKMVVDKAGLYWEYPDSNSNSNTAEEENER